MEYASADLVIGETGKSSPDEVESFVVTRSWNLSEIHHQVRWIADT